MDLERLSALGIACSGDRLDTDPLRRDLWPRDTLQHQLDGSRPAAPGAVAWPSDLAQVEAIMEWACTEDINIIPYGAGSGVCGGAQGQEGSLVIDLKRMNRIEQIDAKNRTVHVQTGILGQHLEDRLAQTGWMTAHSPSSISCSTVGGYIAARSAGQFSSRYGVFDDMLLAARMVTPTGTVLGGQWSTEGSPDPLPLMSGSEGALGVITDCAIRIVPTPASRWLRGYAFPNLESAWEAMRGLMQAGLWPSVLRLYDPVDTRIGGRAQSGSGAPSGPNFAKWLKRQVAASPALQRRLLDLPLALPGLVNRLGGSVGNEVLMILGFEGSHAIVNAAQEGAQPLLSAARDLGPDPGTHWFQHRHAVSYKLAPIFIAGAFADTMEVAAPWSALPDLHQQVRAALGKHAIVMAHFSHAYPEGCSIYFSFMGKGTLDTYDKTWTGALAAAQAAGGTVTHHHGVGRLKAEAASQEIGHGFRIWAHAKERYDPEHRMNPGGPLIDIPDLPQGPPPPSEGPVFKLDPISGLAELDPHAPIEDIVDALASEGWQLRLRPNKPIAQWLSEIDRATIHPWETPFFAVQARFEDGASVRLGPAPRSAAGPDLRWGLLDQANLEMVQLSIRPDTTAIVVRTPLSTVDEHEVRPIWYSELGWGFTRAQKQIAEVCQGFPLAEEE